LKKNFIREDIDSRAGKISWYGLSDRGGSILRLTFEENCDKKKRIFFSKREREEEGGSIKTTFFFDSCKKAARKYGFAPSVRPEIFIPLSPSFTA